MCGGDGGGRRETATRSNVAIRLHSSTVLPLQCLSNAHFLPHIGTGEESVHTYQQMVQAIDELVRKTFQDWTSTLDKDCIRWLNTPLLRISQEKAGMLDVNFDKYRPNLSHSPLLVLPFGAIPFPSSPSLTSYLDFSPNYSSNSLLHYNMFTIIS